MEQLIAYRVMVPIADGSSPPHYKERERGDCTTEQWECERKKEVDSRWKGTGYNIILWPPQKWWRQHEQA